MSYYSIKIKQAFKLSLVNVFTNERSLLELKPEQVLSDVRVDKINDKNVITFESGEGGEILNDFFEKIS
jgi:hypothetical protein